MTLIDKIVHYIFLLLVRLVIKLGYLGSKVEEKKWHYSVYYPSSSFWPIYTLLLFTSHPDSKTVFVFSFYFTIFTSEGMIDQKCPHLWSELPMESVNQKMLGLPTILKNQQFSNGVKVLQSRAKTSQKGVNEENFPKIWLIWTYWG